MYSVFECLSSESRVNSMSGGNSVSNDSGLISLSRVRGGSSGSSESGESIGCIVSSASSVTVQAVYSSVLPPSLMVFFCVNSEQR